MTRLFLIRHGNTVDEETKKVYKGKTDIPLSRTGILRMHGAAAFLSAFRLDRIYTSTLSRSIDSGKIIADSQGIDIEVAPAFDEVDFGIWEGLSFEDVRERYPEAFRVWLKDPATYPPPQGESFRSAQKRSMGRLKKIISEHGGEQIGIVAHAGLLRIMIFTLLGMRLHKIFRVGQGYGCVNIIDVHKDGLVVADLLNFTYYKVATDIPANP